ncbi:hypothetical protein [Streptomyces sp. GMR22]|uniref:hypothetical protein n=1 Tax=Streptomyces sp. GMR22 TaxID=2759524 RepID=UPI0015F98A70|nr:hypothetical protein [Streptomyces sp. GMR22]MBA6434569.1 hypothetical protein [Streptomyces sp. GMR22]
MEQNHRPARRRAAVSLSGALPPPALCGFLLLLAVVCAASYAVGTSVGPVAPGMHRTGTTQDGPGGGHDGGGMEMDGMGTDHGSGR